MSQAGREILIKNVAQALPTYAMSVFLLPLEITKDFERSLSKYWWGGSSNSSSGIHWMSWDRMSKNKSIGGLGFRDFHDFNLALLGKQGWRFVTRPQSLASRIYKARYFPEGHFFEAKLGGNPSFVWRRILEARKVVMDGSRWHLGSGKTVKIIGQPLLHDEVSPYISSDVQGLAGVTVSSLMVEGGREWDVDVVKALFNDRDQQCIFNTVISSDEEEDRLFWGKEEDGVHSVKSAYKLIQWQKGGWSSSSNGSIWNQLWRIKAPPKVLNMVWRALSHCLPTKTNLFAKFVPVSTICPVCNRGEETILHVLVDCEFATHIWRIRGSVVDSGVYSCFGEWLSLMFDLVGKEDYAEIITIC